MNRSKPVLFLFAALLPGLHVGATQARAQAPANKVQEPASSPGARREPIVSIVDGRLNLKVVRRPLAVVLDAVTQESGIPIVVSGGAGDDLVSIELRNVPWDEGLRQLLNGHDAFFLYGVEGKPPASLKIVWVYPRGRGQGLQPTPPGSWASTKELEEKLADPDAGVRARAYEGLIDRQHQRAIDVVLRGLREEKVDDVRTRLLYAALSKGMELRPELLASLATDDASEQVRFLALDALEEHPNAKAIATSALNDPSPQVRIRAREILAALGDPLPPDDEEDEPPPDEPPPQP